MTVRTLAIAVTFIGLASACLAAGEGAEFATRDPVACPASPSRGSGPPSPGEATQAVQCSIEHVVTSFITLAADVRVVLAPKGRPFSYENDRFDGVDPSQPVYDAMGSYTEYRCDRPTRTDDSIVAGRNCQSGARPIAKGVCYKTTFSLWRCSFLDFAHSGDWTRFKIAPPT